jgi:hypothetical protein
MTNDPVLNYICAGIVAAGFGYVLWFIHKYCIIRDDK